MSPAFERVLGALRAQGLEPKRSGTRWTCRCPVHEDSTPSLNIGEGSDGRALVWCFAGCPTPSIVSSIGLSMKDLMPDQDRSSRPPRVLTRRVRIAAPAPEADLRELAMQYSGAVDRAALAKFAMELGVTADSLTRLGIGWTGQIWSFPMTGQGGVVRGIRLRTAAGRKFAVTGGHEGLFVPADLTGDGPLLIAEGPTDTAAALDLGFDAVGRPSCSGGVRLAVEFVQARRPAAVVVVADADEPGRKGAAVLATVLTTYCAEVRMFAPPAKDMRAWLRAGATRGDVQNAIDSAAPLRLPARFRRAAP